MKRYGSLYCKMLDKEMISRSYDEAAQALLDDYRGKKKERIRKEVIEKKDKCVDNIYEMLLNETYIPSPYTLQKIYEPKERTLYIAPFYPDRIIHKMIVNVMTPVWEPMLIKDTYSGIKNRGSHDASNKVKEYVQIYKYVYQFDVSKFYPSIIHDKMYSIVSRKIKDKRMNNLLRKVIYSIEGERNVPIGNSTSTWFGNLYMNELDQFLKHDCKVKAYVRYCDDGFLFSNSREELIKLQEVITKFIADILGMKLSKSEVYMTSQGVTAFGYRHFPTGVVLVKRQTVKRDKSKLKDLRKRLAKDEIDLDSALSRAESIRGWLKHANTFNLRNHLGLNDLIVDIRKRRKIKKRNLKKAKQLSLNKRVVPLSADSEESINI